MDEGADILYLYGVGGRALEYPGKSWIILDQALDLWGGKTEGMTPKVVVFCCFFSFSKRPHLS